MSTTMDEKLAEFSAAVLADAQKQRAELEAENEKIKTNKINSVQDEYLGDAYEKIQAGINEIKKADNEKVLNAQNTMRRELLMRREEIIGDVFGKAREKLKEFMLTDEYTGWLDKKLSDAEKITGNGKLRVYVRSDDEEKINYVIKNRAGTDTEYITQKLDNADFMGGIKVENTENAILVDYSFEELLDAAKSDFLQKSGLRIG